jgi:hypothetical protein
MFTIDQLVAALQGRRMGAGWIAHCPAHDDRSPSLSIREDHDRILVHCHAGCEQRDVIAALRSLGLWPERERRQLPRRTRREIEEDRADLLAASYWAITAEMLAEWVLEELSEVDPERHRMTKLLQTIRLGEASMVAEYRDWNQRCPEMTQGMVRAGHGHDERMQVNLTRWLRNEEKLNG